MTAATCRGCGHSSGRRHTAAEMMTGTGERFEYFECGECGSISRIGTPVDLARYYDGSYYSFDAREQAAAEQSLGSRLRRIRDQGVLFGGFAGLLARWKPNPALNDLRRYLASVRSRRGPWMAILDVGCGGGSLINRLRKVGCRNALGIDPYAPDEVILDEAPRIRRLTLDELPADERYDLIMMHHVLEHADDPVSMLDSAYRHLPPGGSCLVRVPVVSQGPWRRFGRHWAELDPPRHAYVPTIDALAALGESLGFVTARIDWEAEPFAYAASTLAKAGTAFGNRHLPDAFTKEEWRTFEQLATHDAEAGEPARVAVHFRRPFSGETVLEAGRHVISTFDPISVDRDDVGITP